MEKSKFTQALDAVQAELQPVLRAYGFRRRGRTYSRNNSDGIVQVVNFQMGQHPIGGDEIPGVRENLYGWFTVNLGVYLPVVAQVEARGKPKQLTLASDCHLRTRLGALSTPGNDLWWDLNAPPKPIIAGLSAMLPDLGVPFLDRFTSYQACLAYFEAFHTLPGNPPARSALIAGILCHALGKDEAAAGDFSLALEKAGRPEFAQYIHEIRARCLPDSASQ